ncbi:MAG: M64 family metallopeptidase, partial [Planctomycetota bacterium]
TTREAKSQWRVFGESIRFPTPRRPVQLVIKKRGADGLLREIWSGKIDSTSRHIRRPKRSSRKVWTIHEGGANDRCVDLLFLGDGYTAGELDSFLADAKRLTKELFRLEPYRSLSHHFNVRAVHVASPQSGITHPRGGQWRSNPLGLSFNAFDLDRYVLTYRNRAIRDAASVAPYDTLVLLANTDRYGGGGIYNLWSTCVAKSSESPYLFLHEFGHSFAGLADEYYTSAVAYEDFTPPGSEPWEPNITALLDPSRVKWRDLLTDGVEIPTRWRQAEYDRLSLSLQKERGKLRAADADAETMKSYYERVRKATSSILIDDKNAKSVGAFEGAGYQAKGLFRPEIDCIMFSRNRDGFCKVCAQAIVHTIHDHIGGARP